MAKAERAIKTMKDGALREALISKHKRAYIPACQLRAARALLDISAEELAMISGVSLSTIRRAEKKGTSISLVATALADILETNGVDFLGQTGVRIVGDGRGEQAEDLSKEIGRPKDL
jgi:transcriptional regulator with XRE-family HTH domain